MTGGPSRSARWPHVFIFPAPKGKPGSCLEVGGEKICWRVMKKSFGQICDHEQLTPGESKLVKVAMEQPRMGTWSPRASDVC